jgi:hypothetical protein
VAEEQQESLIMALCDEKEIAIMPLVAPQQRQVNTPKEMACRIRGRYLSNLGINCLASGKLGAAGLVGSIMKQRSEAERHAAEVGANLRTALLRKLSYEGVWLPFSSKPSTHQNVFIFDFDDTLLCTSFIMSSPPNRDDKQMKWLNQWLKHIATQGKQLLESSLRKGKTFIVTNAEHSWVQASVAKYLPEILPLLDQVNVISARDLFEEEFPEQVAVWKTRTFDLLMHSLNAATEIINLIAIGDSSLEIEAAQAIGSKYSSSVRVKTVKLMARPWPQQLHQQLRLISTKFDAIVNAAQNKTISVVPATAAANN